MKSEVIPVRRTDVYPCLKHSSTFIENTNIVVLFSSQSFGTVVANNNDRLVEHQIGTHVRLLEKEAAMFEPFEGQVVLSND